MHRGEIHGDPVERFSGTNNNVTGKPYGEDGWWALTLRKSDSHLERPVSSSNGMPRVCEGETAIVQHSTNPSGAESAYCHVGDWNEGGMAYEFCPDRFVAECALAGASCAKIRLAEPGG